MMTTPTSSFHGPWASASVEAAHGLETSTRSSFYGGVRPHSPHRLRACREESVEADHDDRQTPRFIQLRKANPVNVMLPVGRRWLDSLPEEMRPLHLVKEFPRLVNLIALEWRDPAAAARLLTELLGDSRHGRQGFPPAVHVELHRLHFHAYLRLS